MSCPVKLQDLPPGVFEMVLTPENVRARTSTNPLSFPKSRSALWDGNTAGEKLRLHLCSHRKPQVVLLEKALRLAQRHVRHSNKPRLHGFFLGAVSVDSDEECVTVTLDRFDPGRDQAGSSSRVPSALLPRDILVPCLFSTEPESPDSVVQSEAELRQCLKVLQQSVSSRQTLDLSQLIKVKGRVVCSQVSDAVTFGLSWSSVCPSIGVDAQPVRVVPIIPTALLRSLTSAGRALQPPGRKRGFLTMDQTRKLLLLLESDPKASSLPLVGLWMSGVTHIHNPQVWAWCLRFLFSSALQDRVLSESHCFLLVLFADTHRAPQFFQCRGPAPGSGLQLDCQLLKAFQSVTLYQMAVEGQTLKCQLSPEEPGPQLQIFRAAQNSFSRLLPPTAGLCDQDSGVEDGDLSPRPSPSPHPPTQQTRRVQPSVPELSLLIDSSFSSNNCGWQDPGSAHTPPTTAPPTGSISSSPVPKPPPPCDRKSSPPTGNALSSSPAVRPAPHRHSTPYSHLQQPCSCCSFPTYNPTSTFSSPGLLHAAPPLSFSPHLSTPLTSHPAPPPAPLPCLLPTHHTPPPPASPVACSHPAHVPCCDDSPSPHPWHPPPTCVNQYRDQLGRVLPSDTYQLLLHQDRQLRLLQAQVQMLLEAQGKIHSQQVDTQTPRSTASIAVGTGASLFWDNPVQPLPHQELQAPPPSSPSPSPSNSSSCSSSPGLSVTGRVGGSEDKHPGAPSSPLGNLSPQSSVLEDEITPEDQQQSFYHNLMTQLTTRLQESESKWGGEKSRRSLSVLPDGSSSSRKQRAGDSVMDATLRQLQMHGVDVDEDLSECERDLTVESSSTLAGINPAAVVSRLSVSDSAHRAVFPGGSVDLSLEANAIALRYLSDSQLSRLSLGGHAPSSGPASSTDTLMSPTNMSLATRKYMKRYGLIEEEEGEEVKGQPPAEAFDMKLLPQSQLIRDLRPKMQLLARNAKRNVTADKENRAGRRPSLLRAEGSVGNILDLSRLRQLPKLF